MKTRPNEAMPQKALKPTEVEEWIDLRLHRPLAQKFVNAIQHTAITPNQVTLLSGFVGLLAGSLMWLCLLGNDLWVALGGVLLFVSVLLDCADGQLARIRGESSMVGRALDGMVDVLGPLAVFHGQAAFLMALNTPHWYIWPVGWATGITFMLNTQFYDHYKNVYLHNARDNIDMGGQALLSYEAIEAERQKVLSEGRRFDAFVLKVLVGYTRTQRAGAGGNTKIEQTVPLTTCARERQLYRQVFGAKMRLATWLGLGTQLFLLVVTCLLTPVLPWAIHLCWGIILVGGNGLRIYLKWSTPASITEYEDRARESLG